MSQAVRMTDLRRQNRARVLRSVVQVDHVTRAELALDLDLSVATVTNLVTELIAGGLVQESGSVPSNGGRPTSRLKVVADSAYFVGADVGEHGVEAAMFNLALESIDSIFIPAGFDGTTATQTRDVVAQAINRLVTRHADKMPQVRGIGLGVPGIVDTDPDGRTSIYAQSLGWPRIDLDDLTPDLPVAVPVFADNGAKTFAAAELWAGAARGVEHSLVVLIGRGVGVGVIAAGRTMRGATSSAGEWGHTKVAVGGRPCTCGGLGCLEAYIGAAAIAERAREAGLDTVADDQQALSDLVARVRDGSAPHVDFLNETLEYLGIGLANLVNLFNPQQIVIGGWAGHMLFSSHQTQITELVKQHALARPAELITLTESKCSVDPIALGAALLPLEHFIDDPFTRGTA